MVWNHVFCSIVLPQSHVSVIFVEQSLFTDMKCGLMVSLGWPIVKVLRIHEHPSCGIFLVILLLWCWGSVIFMVQALAIDMWFASAFEAKCLRYWGTEDLCFRTMFLSMIWPWSQASVIFVVQTVSMEYICDLMVSPGWLKTKTLRIHEELCFGTKFLFHGMGRKPWTHDFCGAKCAGVLDMWFEGESGWLKAKPLRIHEDPCSRTMF